MIEAFIAFGIEGAKALKNRNDDKQIDVQGGVSRSDYSFYVDPDMLKQGSEEMKKLSRKIDDIVAGLDEVKTGINSCGNQLAFASVTLDRVISRIEEECADTETLADTLCTIATAYELTEKRIIASA